MKPQMSTQEIDVLKKLLSSSGKHIDVLEWGTGGSTIYFTQFLRDNQISYTWQGVEYNKVWYDKISQEISSDSNIDIVLFDVGNIDNKQRYVQMDEYVSYPKTLNKKFDIIIVDGRKRRRCVLEAKQLLKPNGSVILHDARRSYYHCAFRVFPDSRMLLWSGLWQGKIENPGLLRRLINNLLYWLFRIYVHLLGFRPVSK